MGSWLTSLTALLSLGCKRKGFTMKRPWKDGHGDARSLRSTEEGAPSGGAYQGGLAEAARP